MVPFFLVFLLNKNDMEESEKKKVAVSDKG